MILGESGNLGHVRLKAKLMYKEYIRVLPSP